MTHLCEADGHGEEDHDEGVEGEDGLDVLHTLNHLKSGTFITHYWNWQKEFINLILPEWVRDQRSNLNRSEVRGDLVYYPEIEIIIIDQVQ